MWEDARCALGVQRTGIRGWEKLAILCNEAHTTCKTSQACRPNCMHSGDCHQSAKPTNAAAWLGGANAMGRDSRSNREGGFTFEHYILGTISAMAAAKETPAKTSGA